MKRIIFFFALLGIIACDSDDGTEDGNGDTTTFLFYEDAEVNLNANGFTEIRDGVNLVFEYLLTAEDNPNIADDEFTERIVFEIPEDLDSFSFVNEELTTIQAYYDKYCFCLIEGSIPLTNGEITGTKINASTWEISIDVTFEDFETVTKTVNGRFLLTDLR